MILLIQILTIVGYGTIALQDLKEREVSWVLFPFLATTMAVLHIYQTGWFSFWITILINMLLISCIVFILWAVTRFIFRKAFLDVSFGLGDLLFLYAFAIGFPTVTFMYLLIGSIAFSLMGFALMQLFLKSNTVPLAGLICIFLTAVFLISLLPGSPSLYIQ